MRASGKTFRAILKALEWASSGKDVAFMCGNWHMATHAFMRSCSICEDQLTTGSWDKNGQELKVTIKGAGSVRFMPEEGSKNKLRGLDLGFVHD